DHQGWVFAQDFQVMGLGLGMALGAAVARPDRLAVGVIGDGGGIAAIGEVQAAVQQGLNNMVVVIMNDAAYGMEVKLFESLGKPTDLAELGDIDFAATAAGLGAEAITVRSVEDISAVSS